MEYENSNKILCEELFWGEVDVVKEPLEDKSQARRHRDEMHKRHGVELVRLQKVVVALQEMENFCKTKKTCSCQSGTVSVEGKTKAGDKETRAAKVGTLQGSTYRASRGSQLRGDP